MTNRVIKALYSRIPNDLKTKIEKLIAPVTLRWFTRNIIGINTDIGVPPYLPVSIVIPSYNDFDLLVPLLKSIKKTIGAFEYEVIISDDFCDKNNSEKLMTLEDERVQVVLSQERSGFSGAVNRGISKAKFDVVILNSDIIALDFWLENLQSAAYNIDPKIGLVSPHLIYPTGRIQYGGTFHASIYAPQWFGHLDQGRFANDKWANVGKYVTAISGACVYIRRELLEKIVGLDEKYWLGFEDVDLSFSARELGYRSYLEPSSKLIHLESASRGKVQGFKEYASLRLFWDKWLKAPYPNEKTSEVDLFISQSSSTSLKNLAKNIDTNLSNSGIKVTLVEVNDNERIDEKVIEKMSSRNSFKVALDRQSAETVWVSSEKLGVPVLYFCSIQESGIKVSSPEDLALFKPEFTIILGNSVDAAVVSSSFAWSIERTVCPLPFSTSKFGTSSWTPLTNPLIRIVSDDVSFAEKLQLELMENQIKAICSSESELIEMLENVKYKGENEILVIANEFKSASLPLTLFAKEILFISVFSDRTKFQIMDGFNTLCFKPRDFSRAKFLIENLIADSDTQRSILLNGLHTLSVVEKGFAHQFTRALNGRSNEILPMPTRSISGNTHR
jgi:GT2 family glycosyltransferase